MKIIFLIACLCETRGGTLTTVRNESGSIHYGLDCKAIFRSLMPY